MSRRLRTVALVVLTTLGGLAPATAQNFYQPRGRISGPPRDMTVDLGGGIKIELVLIPAGEFVMGSPDAEKGALASEKPQHRVQISQPFYIGRYLVTQEQWEAVMGNNPSGFQGPKDPVENVSWDDCQKFLDRLNRRAGGGRFLLPSEAQWEYACRAGSTRRFCFGDKDSELKDYAWYGATSGSQTHPVGEKKPNAWGLYDVHGSVWEWCADWYDPKYYANSPLRDPRGPARGTPRVLRGGSCDDDAAFCRSAIRGSARPGHRGVDLGLRVLRECVVQAR